MCGSELGVSPSPLHPSHNARTCRSREEMCTSSVVTRGIRRCMVVVERLHASGSGCTWVDTLVTPAHSVQQHAES